MVIKNKNILLVFIVNSKSSIYFLNINIKLNYVKQFKFRKLFNLTKE